MKTCTGLRRLACPLSTRHGGAVFLAQPNFKRAKVSRKPITDTLPVLCSVSPVAYAGPLPPTAGVGTSLLSRTASCEPSLIATVGDLTPETAASLSAVLGPLFAVGTLLMVIRIVTTWYPQIDGSKLPWAAVFLPTEWLLIVTRKVVPPQFGVDVSPIVWVAIISFLNEILLGPQGILNLIQKEQLAGM